MKIQLTYDNISQKKNVVMVKNIVYPKPLSFNSITMVHPSVLMYMYIMI